jgi:hypothetical protein
MDIPIAAHRRILHFTTGSRRTAAAGRRSARDAVAVGIGRCGVGEEGFEWCWTSG